MPPTEEDIAWFRSTFHPIPKPALPDDCVEYSLYIVNSSLDEKIDSEVRPRLRGVQKHASELQKKWLKTYIWQRQGFGLEITKEDGVNLLRGRSEYGDSVEDEWVVVWILRELSKNFQDLWIKIKDSDGEFLLIEASGTLPEWLEPEVAENRVWIHNGALKIIKPAGAARSSKRTTEKLSLQEARNIILNDPKRLMHSSSIEEEAFYRLRNYPAKIEENMHHALMTLPRKIAYLLRQKPAYIAPATESFYLRDPIALKPLQSAEDGVKLIFPPYDLVTICARLSRVSYAQIKSQNFPPPPIWTKFMASKDDGKAFARVESGMKISCGFEMLLSDPQNQDKPAAREMKMLLDDLDTGDEILPTDEEIKAWEMKEDDESWLDISFDDLEAELSGKNRKAGDRKRADFGDVAAQENLQRIVKQFESFLNDDKAGIEGADLFGEDTDDESEDNDSDEDGEGDSGEDKEASFDEDEFTRMMREMMGMPAGVMKEIMTGKRKDASDSRTIAKSGLTSGMSKGQVEELESSDSEDGEEDMQTLLRRMEAELNESGALDLDPSTQKVRSTLEVAQGKRPVSDTVDAASESSDNDEEHDVDVHLARNLLESFKSQAGMAGPGGNMMGMMGLGMPRDEGDNDSSKQNKRR